MDTSRLGPIQLFVVGRAPAVSRRNQYACRFDHDTRAKRDPLGSSKLDTDSPMTRIIVHVNRVIGPVRSKALRLSFAAMEKLFVIEKRYGCVGIVEAVLSTAGALATTKSCRGRGGTPPELGPARG